MLLWSYLGLVERRVLNYVIRLHRNNVVAPHTIWFSERMGSFTQRLVTSTKAPTVQVSGQWVLISRILFENILVPKLPSTGFLKVYCCATTTFAIPTNYWLGVVLPKTLVLWHELGDHYSLQTTKPVSLKGMWPIHLSIDQY